MAAWRFKQQRVVFVSVLTHDIADWFNLLTEKKMIIIKDAAPLKPKPQTLTKAVSRRTLSHHLHRSFELLPPRSTKKNPTATLI